MMKRIAIVLLLGLSLLLSCSAATVTEWYERTPSRVDTKGPGLERTEAHVIAPFPASAPSDEEASHE